MTSLATVTSALEAADGRQGRLTRMFHAMRLMRCWSQVEMDGDTIWATYQDGTTWTYSEEQSFQQQRTQRMIQQHASR